MKLKYTTVLNARGDVVRLQMLDSNPKALMQPLNTASVKVNILLSILLVADSCQSQCGFHLGRKRTTA